MTRKTSAVYRHTGSAARSPQPYSVDEWICAKKKKKMERYHLHVTRLLTVPNPVQLFSFQHLIGVLSQWRKTEMEKKYEMTESELVKSFVSQMEQD